MLVCSLLDSRTRQKIKCAPCGIVHQVIDSTSVSESLITHFKQRKFENPCKMRDDPVLELPVHPPHLPLFISLDLFSFFF